MDEVNGVAKNMTVGSGNNSYKGVSDKDVKHAIRESMIKNGLAILPIAISPKIQMDRWEEVDPYSKETPKAMKTKQSIFTEVETKYLLIHTSGESLELCGYGQWVDTQDKGAGKATTYALKNTLLNMFLIPTGVYTDDTLSDEYYVPPKAKTYTEAERLAMYESFDTELKSCKNMDELKSAFFKVVKSKPTIGEKHYASLESLKDDMKASLNAKEAFEVFKDLSV